MELPHSAFRKALEVAEFLDPDNVPWGSDNGLTVTFEHDILAYAFIAGLAHAIPLSDALSMMAVIERRETSYGIQLWFPGWEMEEGR